MLEGAYSIDSYFFFNKLYRKNIHVMMESHLKSTFSYITKYNLL